MSWHSEGHESTASDTPTDWASDVSRHTRDTGGASKGPADTEGTRRRARSLTTGRAFRSQPKAAEPLQSDSETSSAGDADPDAVARAVCLRQLTGAPKTRAQLADALRRKNVPDEVAERVLDRLGEVRLVDDAAFAEAWVQSRHTGRGLARRALRSELHRRGVDDETIDGALESLDSDAEMETARELVRRKLPSTRRAEPAARFRRLAGMLARKGYPAGLAARVVREELEQAEADLAGLADVDGDDLE